MQRAFAQHDALQCGYCTPGFIVEAAAFVDRWRAEHGDVTPSREQVADALAGHLCRCGAYASIYAAVQAACRGEHDLEEAAVARVEARAKVTGAATYTTDVQLPGQLEGVILRSKYPHAVVSQVVPPEGVVLVDLLGEDRTVRYVGQPIAAVAAPTLDEAARAAARVTVAYDALPAVLDPAAAQADGAALVFRDRPARKNAPSSAEGPLTPTRWRGNVRGAASSFSWRGGAARRRVARARRRSDAHLVSATWTTAIQAHTALEPHACVARWDANGDLHLHVSTQAVAFIVEGAAERWALRPEQVHVVAEHVGGGFGAKVRVTPEVVAAVDLARACRAPVRVVMSRSEELVTTGYRPGASIALTLLAGPDGDLTAMTMDAHGDGGVAVGSGVAALGRLVYGRAPRSLRDFDVVTNHAPGAPFRAPSGPPMTWALEQAVDEMAIRLGEDPIALRRRWDGNAKRHALYEWAAALPVWADRPSVASQTGRFRRGVGVAASNWVYFVDPGTQVQLTVERGVVIARTGTQDIGTGIRSVISDVLREELDLPAERIRVEVGRTGSVHGAPSGGSRTTTSVAPAAVDAARRLTAALGGGPIDARLDAADGTRVVGRRPRDRRGYLTPFSMDHLSVGRGLSGAVHVTEVEVDVRLGKVRVTRVWAGMSVGRVYSQRLARSQVEGSVVQGVGFALYEQRHSDPRTGVVLTDNLEDYRLPGIGDTPEVEVHFHEQGWKHVPGGGVGLGEVATVGVAASIGNAVHAATGWRPLDLPIRPDRLLEGIAR